VRPTGELEQIPTEHLDIVPAVTALIIDRAARRGDIGSHPVPPHVRDTPAAPLRHELARIVDDIAIPAIERAAGGAGR
jgi:hypothetical protein